MDTQNCFSQTRIIREVSENLVISKSDLKDIRDEQVTVSPDFKRAAARVYLDKKDAIAFGESFLQKLSGNEVFKSARREGIAKDLANMFGSLPSTVILDGKRQVPYADVESPLYFSPDSKRFAYFAKRGTNLFAVVDGKEDPQTFVSILGAGFTADSKSFIYLATSGTNWSSVFLVINGKPSQQFNGFAIIYDREPIHYSSADISSDRIIFGPSGSRFACIGFRHHKDWVKYWVVVDGNEYGPYDGVIQNFCFSPDGKRFAYNADKGKKHVLVVDGEIKKEHDAPFLKQSLVFSPDGNHLAYFLQGNARLRLQVDDQQFVFDRPNLLPKPIVFSPDSQSTVTSFNGQIVLNGRVVKKGGYLHGPFFASDNQTICHASFSGRSNIVAVLSGTELKFQRPVENMLFSSDGKRFAYVRSLGDFHGVVIDGKPESMFQHIEKLAFSRDGKRFGYLGTKEVASLVVDGKTTRIRGYVVTFDFTPDGHHYFCVGGESFRETIIIDGQPGRPYLDICAPFDHPKYRDGPPEQRAPPPVLFSPPNQFRYLAKNEEGYLLVEETLR